MIIYTNGEEKISARKLTYRYRNHLDETNEEIKIGNSTFLPSQVLEEVDSIAFELGLSDWLDAGNWEETDDDDEDEDSEGGDETPLPLLSSEIDLYD